jgi:radical SAM protein with 4Fe4S-binding SPASM domain
VLDNSCQNACPHCFLDPGKGDWAQARDVAFQAFKLGYSVYFYATEISQQCYDIYRNIGQDMEDASICMRGDSAIRNLRWLTKKRGRIGFSLHGSRKETHELISGPDTFEATIEAIKYVSEYNSFAKTNIWTVVHRKNMNEIRSICEIARDLGVDYINLAKLSYLGRARDLGPEWFLEVDEVSEIVHQVEDICNSGKFPNPHITLSPNWGMTKRQAEKFEQGGKLIYYPTRHYCPAGRQHFTVESSSLNVYPCHHLSADDRFIIGHWSGQGLVIENNEFVRSLNQLDAPCGSCDIQDVCGGGCRSEAIAEHLRVTGEYNFHAGLKHCRNFFGGE